MFDITTDQRDLALTNLLNRWGIDYRLGAEVAADTFPTAIDCSELVERVYVDVLGVKTMPDGSFNQLPFCQKHGMQVHYPTVKAEPLDLVFLLNADRKSIGHVAIVYGEVLPHGGVLLIEARGRPWNHVMLTPLDKFIAQFGSRYAGLWRILNVK